MCVPCTVSFIDWFWDLVNTQIKLVKWGWTPFKLVLRNWSSWVFIRGGGGTDLERGYGDVRSWRPPFHASPAARKGPISSKRVGSQDPLLRKFGNFSLNSLKFHPNFSSQAPKFGNFPLTSPQIWKFSAHKPQIWKFSAHKPPFSEANVSSQAPHFGNPGSTPPPEKKLSAPPRVFIQWDNGDWLLFHSKSLYHGKDRKHKLAPGGEKVFSLVFFKLLGPAPVPIYRQFYINEFGIPHFFGKKSFVLYRNASVFFRQLYKKWVRNSILFWQKIICPL